MLALTVHAQSNYKPGYIITNSHDTMIGWIDYRTDRMNALHCHFKADLTGNEQIFLPDQIFGYRFSEAGKFYVSKTIVIDGKPRNVFLEYLIQGIMNLYFYTTNAEKNEDCSISNHYFFENQKGEMISVTKAQDKIITDSKGISAYWEDQKYKGLIRYIFNDCEPVKQKAWKAEFTHKSIISLTKDYHNLTCTTGQKCIEFETTPDSQYIKTKFSVYSGVENEAYAPSIILDDYFYNHFIQVNNSPFIGAEIGFSIPRWKKSLSLQTDFSLTRQHREIDRHYPDYTEKYDNTSAYCDHFDYYYDAIRLGLNLGVRYTYQKWKLQPSLEAGVIFNYGLNISERATEYYYTDISKIEHFTWTKKEVIYYSTPGHYVGFGFDYPLRNDHAVFFRINRELRNNILGIREHDMITWKIKLGYTL